MLRLLIKDITVEKVLNPKRLILHIRWQGGAIENIQCDIPLQVQDRLRYGEPVLSKVRSLAKNHADSQIAQLLNQDGLKTSKGKAFTQSSVRWIRYRYRLPKAQLKRPHELTVKEIAERFDVTPGTVYYWIEHGYLDARRIQLAYPYWITLDSEKEKELRERAKTSHERKARFQHSERPL